MLKISNSPGSSFETSEADASSPVVLADTVAALEADIVEMEAIADEAAYEKRWTELDGEHPNNSLLFVSRVRRIIRRKDFDEAVALVDGHEFSDEDLIAKAELLFDSRQTDRADEVYSAILDADPERRDVRISYGKRLLAYGHLQRAHDLLLPLRESFAEGTKSQELVEKAQHMHAMLTELEGESIAEVDDARIVAMKHAILRFRGRTPRRPSGSGLGRLCLITGGLGAGGAERQLTRLAVELERARRETGSVAGIPLKHPVQVLVRAHDAERQNDFYLSDLNAAGVDVHQINEFTPVAPKNLGIEDEALLDLLGYMPSSVNYGVKRLVDYFRDSKMDTVSIWQDGACLFAGLAALIAGVPHIQLAIRGLPPSLRRHMFRPEYEAFYRAMAEIPGVSFISNNISAARAYAEWLDIPLDRFAIVYNGVEPMKVEPSSDCEKRWKEFVKATPDAEHTVGSVFRFNTDKQPLMWIRFAARYLKKHPKSRIVMVGGGRLLPNAQELAKELGIAERILFVGASSHVGYWMAKFDVLLLMSRYEGLPNVLIEAQYMGVRVVTTPAGGAAECLIEGVTGEVLECAEKPDLNGVVAVVRSVACKSADRSLFDIGGAGRTFLDTHFSIPHMLAQYVSCTCERLRAVTGSGQEESREAA